MTKSEFLEKLRQALGNDLTGSVIQENVDYYNQYINDEVRSGRSEAEVISELGDPWVIAQTIIDTTENRAKSTQQSSFYEPNGAAYDQQSSQRADAPGRKGLWKLILVLLGIIGVLIAIVAVIGGIISFIAPILVPVLIIAFVIRLFGRKR